MNSRNLFLTLTLLSSLTLSAGWAAPSTDLKRLPSITLPEAGQTAIWNIPAAALTIEKLPDKQPAFDKAFAKLLEKSPERLGLPAGVTLRTDSIQLIPEATGIPAMAWIRLSQTVEGTPVAGTEIAMTLQWFPNRSAVHYISGRLYPDLKVLPEKAIPAEAAEKRVWQSLVGEMSRFSTASGGSWVRWVDGRWRTIQVYGVDPQGLVAAIDGSGMVYVWPGHVVALTPAPGKKTDKPL